VVILRYQVLISVQKKGKKGTGIKERERGEGKRVNKGVDIIR